MASQDQALSDVWDIIAMSSLPMALKAALELDVIGILAKSGSDSKLSASQIAAQIPTSNPNAAVTLDRILRVLAGNSVLSSSLGSKDGTGKAERLYGLTPMCRYLLPDSDGVSLAPIVLMTYDKVHMESCYFLKDAVLEGCEPFGKAFGMSAFEYYGRDPRFSKLFNEGMYNHSTSTTREFLTSYRGLDDLEGVVVDVGGGIGAAIKMIVSKYPHIQGINFDLPYVIDQAPCYPGVTHVSGDMFQSVPRGDVIFMKWILHDWDDERCIRLLKNCWTSLPESGKVIVVEWILPSENLTDKISRLTFGADLMMLAYNSGGKERTLEEFQTLANASGFSTIKVFPGSMGISAIELYKTSS